MIAVDTNIVVRAIVDDDEQQVRRVTALLQQGDLFVPTTVLLETEWVLRGLYDLDRSTLATSIERFCGLDSVTVADADNLRRALDAYRAGADFADVLHVLECEAAHVSGFMTFDIALRKRLYAFSDTVTINEP